MVSRLLEKFKKFLVEARKKANHNHLSVQKASELEKKHSGAAFYVSNTTVRHYEEGGLPSPPKLLTLARIYKVPVGEFFRPLGASDEEICACSRRLPQNKEEQRLIASLLKILREGDEVGVSAVKSAIRAALQLRKREN